MSDIDKKMEDFKSWYNNHLSFHESAMRCFSEYIQIIPLVDSVSARIKSYDECIRKFKRRYLPDIANGQSYEIKDFLSDIIGIRAICFYSDDIEVIERELKKQFRIIETTDKSGQLEKTDDKFGYKSLHLILELKKKASLNKESQNFCKLKFELQVRTVIQDAWSNLDHKIKYKKSIPQKLSRRINRLSALFEIAEDEFMNIRDEIMVEEKRIRDRIQKGGSIEKNKVLDVFRFLFVSLRFFPDYQFYEYKADGFVQEIIFLNPDFTEGDLDNALKQHMNIANTIEKKGNQRLNPYTKIRYCLFQYDNNKFKDILSNHQIEMIYKYS